MKKSLIIILGIFLLIGNNISYSQNQKHKFDIKAKSVEGEIYPIEIVLPDGYDSTKRYPIVYFTDWWFSSQSFPLTFNRLRLAGVIEPFIMVGIGTKGDMTDWRMERLRDLTPTNVPDYDIPDSLETGSYKHRTQSVIVEGEGHLLAASTAMIKGLKFIYGTK